MVIGISGGTGLIGRRLTNALIQRGDQVKIFSRQKSQPQYLNSLGVEFIPRSIPDPTDWKGIDGFVNLAGENLAGVRWTESTKRQFRVSRVDHTKSLVQSYLIGIQEGCNLQVFIQASAIGYYGSTEYKGRDLDEDSPSGIGYLAELSRDWEEASNPLMDTTTRIAIPRIGVVLDPLGGALSKLIPIFRSFVGGPIGSGDQGMSWIHFQDLVGILLHLIQNPNLKGVFNATAPNPVTNHNFSKSLGGILNRPSSMWTPGFAIQLLFGEGAKIVTEGQIVHPRRILESGYRFQFPELQLALENLLNE